MIIAHRIQLLPNNRQRRYFSQACGVARFAWNWALDQWNQQYDARAKWQALPEAERIGPEPPYPNGQALKKQFSARIDAEWPWMRETSSYAYQQVFPELEQAWKRFFKVVSAEERAKGKGRPRFKKKGRSRDSFYLANTGIQVDGRHVKIAKLGRVRMREPLRFQGKIMSAFAEMRRQLEYKASRTGSKIVAINRFSPSSKTCSACGSYQTDMPLSVREWTCPDCGTDHDRDVNAAKNIRAMALLSTGGAPGRNARGLGDNGASAPTSQVETRTKRLGKLHPRRKTLSGGH